MEHQYILNICDLDKIFMVCRRSRSNPLVYRTVAECIDRVDAEFILHAFIDKPNLTPSGTATCEGELHQTPTVEKLSSGDHSIPIGPERIDFS